MEANFFGWSLTNVEGLMESLASTVGPPGVGVVVIEPG
jgi:NAD(P)-dependent dehydrogenase (short-subunit alcohol dehydrogenase family)